MGSILECIKQHKFNRRVSPYDSYCLICLCEEYAQDQHGSTQCYCGHALGEHRRI